jgi:broad specificity phosphatase PhoE/GNAT superfamily N-acetyltransferase
MASNAPSKDGTPVPEGLVRPSLSIRLIRHAESQNNQVYRDARFLFRGGTPEFDESGWNAYVDLHRKADPGLSEIGVQQAQHLADFLVPHLQNQASHPVRIISSPMKRTLETIRPTLERLQADSNGTSVCNVIVNAFYHESEGCHVKEQAVEGMNPQEITQLMKDATSDLEFTGFPLENRGWYVHGVGAETRSQSEARAAKFYTWLCEHLDEQLYGSDAKTNDDVFDAGVALPEEEHECEHDLFTPKTRKRRTTLLIGHGDFMSLVLKRIVAGFGHVVETEGIPHRSAFVHFNTAITELEYFGHGRFLVMGVNSTPHFAPSEYSKLRTGGSLKDGWSFIVPPDAFVLDAEVSIGFQDELEQHVKEQTEALKSLYLGGTSEKDGSSAAAAGELSVEEVDGKEGGHPAVCIVVKRGLQVAGCAWYDESTGRISDLVVRPSARESQVGEALINAVRAHARKLKRSGSILVQPRNLENKEFLVGELGFQEVDSTIETGKRGDVHVEI